MSLPSMQLLQHNQPKPLRHHHLVVPGTPLDKCKKPFVSGLSNADNLYEALFGTFFGPRHALPMGSVPSSSWLGSSAPRKLLKTIIEDLFTEFAQDLEGLSSRLH
uniref:Uncharacterized protein n=1 Tax=Cucumis sativus TaxID=3659 RepID=A0A0A0KYY8_CUCSA